MRSLASSFVRAHCARRRRRAHLGRHLLLVQEAVVSDRHEAAVADAYGTVPRRFVVRADTAAPPAQERPPTASAISAMPGSKPALSEGVVCVCETVVSG